MLKTLNPSSVAKPPSNYSQAVLVPPNARWLYVSGQLGVDRDGTLASGFEAQMATAMANVFKILDEADMSPSDIVTLRVFAADNGPETVESYRRLRDTMMGDHAPAALFVAVDGFTNPAFRVEIEAVAAAT
ncbi:RidA family protein [Notoacmeibacter ruber]|uniref:RidA family protein n=1 Tax=Notoacmeibacter ruber TaxID=2670375 RepID=A0A3L7JF21_9HYPH|nr:RidA family protein [Notoacmeibacter ruber]RLQ89080.1 RidA family protein [Notoacmeibacter ruber]